MRHSQCHNGKSLKNLQNRVNRWIWRFGFFSQRRWSTASAIENDDGNKQGYGLHDYHHSLSTHCAKNGNRWLAILTWLSKLLPPRAGIFSSYSSNL